MATNLFKAVNGRNKANSKMPFKLCKRLPNGEVHTVPNAVGYTAAQVEATIAFYKDLQPENEFFVVQN